MFEFDSLRREVNRQRRRLKILISTSATIVQREYGALKEDIDFTVCTLRDEARTTVDRVQAEIKPLGQAVRDEWLVFQEVVSEDQGVIADSVRAAREAVDRATAAVKEALAAATTVAAPQFKGIRNTRLRTLARRFAQFGELIFGAELPISQDSQSIAGSALAEIAALEQSEDHDLRLTAAAAAVALLGVLYWQPLQLVSGGVLLFAALPDLRGALTDLAVDRRITFRVLQSVSLLGLLAGRYFLICSLTSAMFHLVARILLRAEGRSRRQLASTLSPRPEIVRVLVGDDEIEVPFERLARGDTLIVSAGQIIAVDGVITRGSASVSQRALTADARPVATVPGDTVLAASTLLAGRIELRVEELGAETRAARIRHLLVSDPTSRATTQERSQSAADRTVLPSFALAGGALAFRNPLSALAVVNSDYAGIPRISTPLGLFNCIERLWQTGVLVTQGRTLELASEVDSVVFDEPGGLSESPPAIGRVYLFAEASADELLSYAAAIQANLEHPFALAIRRVASQRGLVLPALESAAAGADHGSQATIAGRVVSVGAPSYLASLGIHPPEFFESARNVTQTQETQHASAVVFVALGNQMAGAIELWCNLRPEAKEVVAELKKRGLKLHIVSSGETASTKALAAALGMDDFSAEASAREKVVIVEKLRQDGRRVCIVGNEPFALMKGVISVSLRDFRSPSLDSAQVVLADGSLQRLGRLFEVAGDYTSYLRTLGITTYAPGLASVAGVFFLGTGVLTSLALSNLSALIALVSTIWPALKNMDGTET